MKTIFLFFVLVSATAVSAHSLPINKDYSGTWEYSVETPNGLEKGAIVLNKTQDGYEAHLAHGGSDHPVKNLKVGENFLQFDVLVDGTAVTVKGDFNGDELKAVALVEGMELPFTAKRKA